MSLDHPPAARLDVVGLGNAVVDVIAEVDEAVLERLALPKGAMTLLDEARMRELYASMGPAVEMSGGSCANTMAALAALGAKVAYTGKVQRDQLGEIFGHDIRAAGVRFATPPLDGGPPTARCLVFVTPDAQRTMATYLGACVELGPDDLDQAALASASITYLEGYLWDRPAAKAACLEAAKAARRHGRKVALTLSDPFCVDRWRDEFQDLIDSHVDILIANEIEIMSLFQLDDFERAVQETRKRCSLAALTRSAAGSVIATADEVHRIAAAPVERVVDSTGAGDLYAAGLLYGLTHGLPPAVCGRLGSLAAARILEQLGARAERPLAPLVEMAKRS